MMTLNKVITYFVLIIAVAGGILWLFTTWHTQAQAKPETRPFRTNEDITEEKAKVAKLNNDETSIKDLVEHIVNSYAAVPLPQDIKDIVVRRIVHAELEYRAGRQEGISELNAVRCINEMANTMSLPTYAKVLPSQIRAMRINLLVQAPTFMEHALSVGKDQDIITAQSIKPEMSPLEAAHVVLLLTFQKLHNPAFQLTPDEWQQQRRDKAIERWQMSKSGAKQAQQVADGSLAVRSHTDRADEIRSKVHSGFSTMKKEDAVQLMQRAFSTLGVKE